MKLGRVVLLLAVGVVASSCDGGSSSDPETFALEYCKYISPCCEMAGRPADGAQCRALFGAFGTGQKIDESRADACLAALKAASSDPGFCDGGLNAPACDDVAVH